MFDNLMGNMEEQQAAMQEKLATILVEVEAGDGAIKVQASANKQITNISIDATKMDLTDKEELEDLSSLGISGGKSRRRNAKFIERYDASRFRESIWLKYCGYCGVNLAAALVTMLPSN
jgi:DNA-binding protein YbaB